MKKVIFGGFCMLSSLMGIFITLYTAYLNPSTELVVTVRRDFFNFLKITGLLTPFVLFCFLGVVGLLFSVFGVFEHDDK